MQMEQTLQTYLSSINQKVDTLEETMIELEAENKRLIAARESAYIERDACIGLLMRLANKTGFTVGVAPGNLVVADLPGGQISWEFGESEAHLFSELPAFRGTVEELSIEEKYYRVMNPGV